MNTTTTTNGPQRLIAILRSSQPLFIGLALSVVFLAGLAFHAGPAHAHSAYESSVPADGETVPESPDVVEITFSQEMRRAQGLPNATVVNQSGDTVSLDTTLSDDDRTLLTIDLAPSLPDGRYTVIYHVLSDADGDDSQGAFHFFVGEPSGETPSPAVTDPADTPEPTATASPPPTDDDDDDGDDDDSDGVPIWGLIVGIAATAVIAGVAGVRIGRAVKR